MNTSVKAQRVPAVEAAVNLIRAIEDERGVTPESLAEVRGVLLQLAAREDLFPLAEFPPPPPGDKEKATRYLLHEDPDQRLALYLNSMNPGRSTNPHNHTTWAVVVAIEGQELNKVYQRTDGGRDPEQASLRVAREIMVEPGQGICLLPDDIHSIHILGDKPTRHLHMYGKSLETLTERLGFNLETGQVVRYNQHYMAPTVR
jgi:predicted metal-dependent enzyme (double-stranded beta helix superfamily)